MANMGFHDFMTFVRLRRGAIFVLKFVS